MYRYMLGRATDLHRQDSLAWPTGLWLPAVFSPEPPLPCYPVNYRPDTLWASAPRWHLFGVFLTLVLSQLSLKQMS